jgi:hypothetical protein
MSTFTDNVEKAALAIRSAEAGLLEAQSNYNLIRQLCGQRGYTITIATDSSTIRVPTAICDSHTWQGTLVRGRELIHLCVLKALDSIIDTRKTALAAARATLKELVNA